MSQQLFALCLVASLVALVSAQSFNPQNCANGARKNMESFQKEVMQSMQQFTNSMQETGSQAVDMSSIQGDVDKLVNSMASLQDMSQGFDMGRWTSMYTENISTMASIMSKSFRMNLMTGSMDTYMQFASSMMSSYTRLMQKMVASCAPNVRLQPL